MKDKQADDKRRYAKRISLFKEMLGGKCVSCNSIEDLEFDHIDPSLKKFKITDTNRKLTLLLEELTKCQLLCKKCHWDKTGRAQHGSLTMYSHHLCRCDACRASWNSYHIKYASVV